MRARVALLLPALIAAPTLVAAQPSERWTVNDVLRLRAVEDVAVSPDGGRVAYVVTHPDMEQNEHDSEIWVVSADGGEPLRLTRSPGGDRAPQWMAEGEWLAYLSDRGKETQVYGIDPRAGEAWQVTDSPTGVRSFRLSPDGRRIAFTAFPEEQDSIPPPVRPIVWDSAYAAGHLALWTARLEDRRAGARERRSSPEHHVESFAWAPDSRRLAWAARPDPDLGTREEGQVYVAGPADPSPRVWTDMPGGTQVEGWEPDVGLLVSGPGAQNRWTLNHHIWLVPEGGGQPVSLTPSLDASPSYVAAGRSELLVGARHRTGARLHRIPLRNGRPAGEPEILTDDRFFYTGFSASRDRDRLAFIAEGPKASPDVFTSPTEGFAARRLTRLNPWADELALGEQRVVRWASRYDGEEIEGVLTLPVGYRQGDRVPLLTYVHGGPAGVSSDRFGIRRGAYPVQVYAGLGYAVLQPNYRGSTAYGERFRRLIEGAISNAEWIDVDSGVDHLLEAGIADESRLGLMGWSYGGHQTYWGVTRTDRFRAASAGAGPNDLISMYSQTDITEFYHTYLGPTPWEDWDLWEERSAYRNVTEVTTPLLIQVGEDDERVPAEQSIQFYEAMKRIGNAPVKLVVYPDQPHGVRAPHLQRDLMTRNLEWFTRWIPTDRGASGRDGPGSP